MEQPSNHFAWALVAMLVEEKGYQLIQVERRPGEEQYPIFHLVAKNQISLQYIRISMVDHMWRQVMERERAEMQAASLRLCQAFQARRYDALNLYLFNQSPLPDIRSYVQEGFATDGVNNLQVGLLDWEAQKYIGQGQILYSLHCAPEQLSYLLQHYSERSVDEYVHRLQQQSLESEKQHRKNRQIEVIQKHTTLTYAFLVFNILMFFVLSINGGSTNTETLIRFGAKVNPLIVEGEWWRLFTPMFLHIGIYHLMFNSMALYVLGSLVERMYGSQRFVLIYLIAGIGGNVASFIFSSAISAGASGAVFGLLGALLYFGLRNRQAFMNTIGFDVLVMVGLNLSIGFIVPGIDNFAHLGGLIVGFLAAFLVGLPRERQQIQRILAALLLIIFLGGGTVLGTNEYKESADYLYRTGHQALTDGDFASAKVSFEKMLEKDPALRQDPQVSLFYGLSLLNTGDAEGARQFLEGYLADEQTEKLPNHYFLLSYTYKELKDVEKERSALEQVLRMEPNESMGLQAKLRLVELNVDQKLNNSSDESGQ
ncbi:rhomboid family intramembrane serine protease [Rubeoparvulum massiliense]|uniref:rhomboid family intramembrane serine protease n=1 Tax=Rubeoparvulum massiliense TaxID=1631346 RepID=UPI0011C9EDA3|nr:rhomboid family intramembrane serine protease [Rubeoparvulum massiliense]